MKKRWEYLLIAAFMLALCAVLASMLPPPGSFSWNDVIIWRP